MVRGGTRRWLLSDWLRREAVTRGSGLARMEPRMNGLLSDYSFSLNFKILLKLIFDAHLQTPRRSFSSAAECIDIIKALE